VDQHDADDRPVQTDLVEHAGDVHVHRQIRHCLGQQERKQNGFVLSRSNFFMDEKAFSTVLDGTETVIDELDVSLTRNGLVERKLSKSV
jgi:hypothetical protein